jgi:hypothetical protein
MALQSTGGRRRALNGIKNATCKSFMAENLDPLLETSLAENTGSG